MDTFKNQKAQIRGGIVASGFRVLGLALLILAGCALSATMAVGYLKLDSAGLLPRFIQVEGKTYLQPPRNLDDIPGLDLEPIKPEKPKSQRWEA